MFSKHRNRCLPVEGLMTVFCSEAELLDQFQKWRAPIIIKARLVPTCGWPASSCQPLHG